MKISVVGLGYVGSVAAGGLAASGHEVLGIDIDAAKVAAYREGSVPVYEPGLAELVRKASHRGSLRFFQSDEVAEPLGDVIMIAAGTPATDTGAADLGQVHASLAWVKERRPRGAVILMKSTVPPGTGALLSETVLAGTGLKYIANPEFLREGSTVHDWFHPDRIVIGGCDEEAIAVARSVYAGIEAPVVVTGLTSAEMIKYASNAFLATKISFINEIAALCDRLGATIDEVGKGLSLDPRIGPSFLRAGVGYGGSCFPKDVRALDQVALSNDHDFELLRAVITVNNRQRLLPLQALRERFSPLAGTRVGVLGLSFKPQTDDVREAPSLELIRALVEEGVVVTAYDPQATSAARRVLPSGVRFTKSPEECADGTQALVLMTEWTEIVDAEWPEIAVHMEPPRLMFDGRNALDAESMRRHGFEYRGVGRGVAPSS